MEIHGFIPLATHRFIPKDLVTSEHNTFLDRDNAWLLLLLASAARGVGRSERVRARACGLRAWLAGRVRACA